MIMGVYQTKLSSDFNDVLIKKLYSRENVKLLFLITGEFIQVSGFFYYNNGFFAKNDRSLQFRGAAVRA